MRIDFWQQGKYLIQRMMIWGVCMGMLASCSATPSQSTARPPMVFEVIAASDVPHSNWHAAQVRHSSETVYLAPKAFLQRHDVSGAVARMDVTGKAIVIVQLTPAGGIKLTTTTRMPPLTHIAIVINRQVIGLLSAQEGVTGNRLGVSGFVSLEEAQAVADSLSTK